MLCLQDTTELDYNGQEIEGLGPLNYEAQRGLYLHPTYVVSPEREPLGVFNAWSWAREFKDKDGQRGGACEGRRWTEIYERIAESAELLPQTRHVCIGDRESDMLELMVKARDLGYPADYLVRSQHNRVLPGAAGHRQAVGSGDGTSPTGTHPFPTARRTRAHVSSGCKLTQAAV